ncbi:hypothetical protein EGW08_004581 [Elysia chlorotica]|uniref:Uncharacterized protein n=1 Tax=Elysia chlorotica TaxID=188477 RepID=A0A3S1BN92_ELYCH|nr:hypothetical protein EGW08_004581 [Elysia chlorotica]
MMMILFLSHMLGKNPNFYFKYHNFLNSHLVWNTAFFSSFFYFINIFFQIRHRYLICDSNQKPPLGMHLPCSKGKIQALNIHIDHCQSYTSLICRMCLFDRC